MRLRSGAHGLQEPVADLHALDGLDAHDRRGQGSVEPAIRFDVGADAGGHAVCEHFYHAADGIGGGLDLVDARDHPLLGRLVQRTHRGCVQRFDVVGGRQRCVIGVLDARPSDGDHMRHGANAERLLKEPRGDRAQRHAGRGLARAGALQHGSRVVEPVFAHAGEVGVSRPRPAQRGVAPLTRQIVVEWIRAHHLGPFRPFGVRDLDGHR